MPEEPKPNGSSGLGKKGSIITAALPAIVSADDFATKAIIGGIVALVVLTYAFLEWSKR